MCLITRLYGRHAVPLPHPPVFHLEVAHLCAEGLRQQLPSCYAGTECCIWEQFCIFLNTDWQRDKTSLVFVSQTDTGYYNGYVYFRQTKDKSIRRGYFQKVKPRHRKDTEIILLNVSRCPLWLRANEPFLSFAVGCTHFKVTVCQPVQLPVKRGCPRVLWQWRAMPRSWWVKRQTLKIIL